MASVTYGKSIMAKVLWQMKLSQQDYNNRLIFNIWEENGTTRDG